MTSLWIAYFVVALAGLGTSPVVSSKPVAAAYSRRRGIAIGVALTGVGVGGFVVPLLTNALVAWGGWKWGYFGIGACAIVAAPVLWLTLNRRFPTVPSSSPKRSLEYPGLSFREAFRSPTFWLLSLVALLGGAGMAGPVAHLVPALRDQAISPTGAAGLASMVGLSTIVGRLVTGLTLDLIDRPLPGLLFFGLGALGAMLLAFFGAHYALVGVLLIGAVVGAEMDLLAYFASRYFGLRAHATIFGWNYGVVALGAAIAPVVVGALRDRQGTYAVGLALCGAALALAGAFCAFLGRYRYAANAEQATLA